MSSLAEIISRLNAPNGDVELAETLCFIEEIPHDFISNTEDLFQLLSCIHSIIDSSSRRIQDTSETPISDIAKSHALSTYTSLIIQFEEFGQTIRSQYTKALVEMIQRRSVKRRDYVNWYLRSVACECLQELELAFPSEVSEALKLSDWLKGSVSAGPTPIVVEAVQDEQFASFESYSKLLLCCCMQFEGSIAPKSLMKIISLILDSLEFSSSWFRSYVATSLPRLIQRQRDSSDDDHLWTFAVVNHHFSRLLLSVHAHQVHAFLTVSLPFVNEWDRCFSESVVDRIFAIVLDETTKALPVRQIAVYWLCELADDYYLQYSILDRRKLLIRFLTRDPWQLVEVKLQALLRLSFAFKSIPRSIMNCVSLTAGGKGISGVAFRFIARLLTHFSCKLEEELFYVPEVLIESLKASSSGKNILASLVRLLQILNQTPKVQLQLLLHLGQFVNNVQPPSKTLLFFPLLAFMACHASFDSRIVVSALNRFLTSSWEPQDGWSKGLKVLELARLVVIHHGCKKPVEDDVVSLLEVLQKKGIVDIEDRAKMLIKFISRLSHTDRIPFLCPDLNRDVNRKENPQAMIDLGSKENIFESVKFSKNFELRKSSKININDGNWAIFTPLSESVLPFTLQFDPSVTASQVGSMFGIELSFSLSDGFERISPVKIPFLTPPLTHSQASFPHKYDVLLNLVPVSPAPAFFYVDLIFTDEHGSSHSGRLTNFKVSFEDLFATVPRPVSEWPSLFCELWVDPFSKLLALPRLTVMKLISERLSPFEIADISKLPAVDPFDFDQENLLFNNHTENHHSLFEEKAVIIHLPPAYHLLLRFVMGEHTCLVWIATDRVEILALLDSFFNRWIHKY